MQYRLTNQHKLYTRIDTGQQDKTMRTKALHRNARLAITVGLTIYGGIIMSDFEVFRLLDNVDLAIHETGHIIFTPFGEFMHFLGGTLLQLIFPLAFVLYFLRQGDRHAATVPLWWLGQNCWNIARYVADARAQELPLVGGGIHDWNFLLGRMGLLSQDVSIGNTIEKIGVGIFFFSVAAGMATFSAIPKPAKVG